MRYFKYQMVNFGMQYFPFSAGGCIGAGVCPYKQYNWGLPIAIILLIISYLCLEYKVYLMRRDRWPKHLL
jgi:hypothetical protein